MARRDNAPATHQTSRQLKANEEEWERQVKLLKRRIKDVENLGADAVDIKIPEKPKRITPQAIERVKNIRRPQIQKKALQVDSETGEAKKWIPPKRGEAQQRREEVKQKRQLEKQQQEKVNIVDVELENLKRFIESYENPYAKQSALEGARINLLHYVDYAIMLYGEKEIAMRAEQAANATDFAKQAMDESNNETQRAYLNGFSDVLFGRAFSVAELVAIESGRENLESFDFEDEEDEE